MSVASDIFAGEASTFSSGSSPYAVDSNRRAFAAGRRRLKVSRSCLGCSCQRVYDESHRSPRPAPLLASQMRRFVDFREGVSRAFGVGGFPLTPAAAPSSEVGLTRRTNATPKRHSNWLRDRVGLPVTAQPTYSLLIPSSCRRFWLDHSLVDPPSGGS
ncbi:hypothetical protein GOBAR_AA26216 [Gossypium barbadense]|uniref:Uncharacterized protein n=1 Tax=Gossypium barbadense TaxID=3634 RepID=A0A2P5WTQ5_GOSBA|nr:hypothetical protein GOBAR_AA26216 [Gossypium barbadense]